MTYHMSIALFEHVCGHWITPLTPARTRRIAQDLAWSGDDALPFSL